MGRPRVVIYPIASNPYQDILYSHTKQKVHRIESPRSILARLFHLPILLARLVFFRLTGAQILHMHWIYGLEFPGRRFCPNLTAKISTWQVNIFLKSLDLLRFKLIWTVHDMVPHVKHTNDDLDVAARLLARASKVIVLSDQTLLMMKAAGLEPDLTRCVVIPHGNYIGVYPNTVSRSDARQQLGIADDDFVLLFFGRIEPYKNVPVLIRTVKILRDETPNLQLLVAGETDRNPSVEDLQAEQGTADYVGLHLCRIPDEEVQVFYNAADVAVHPFRAITNSGSVLLSASFGKPIVGPRLGALADLPESASFLYPADRGDGLINALRCARRADLASAGQAALRYAESMSWERLGQEVDRVYEECLQEERTF